MDDTQNPSLTILIADDEPLARERLRRLIGELPGYRVCGEAADGETTMHKVTALSPDIVLLDIHMPGINGLEAANRLTRLQPPPAVIFCTAYDHYAIQAFEASATAYLLKPVRREALAEALTRAGHLNRVQQQMARQQQKAESEQLAVRTHRGTMLIPLADIFYCEADHKYVTIRHTGGDTVSDFTLKELEAGYPEYLLRIHRNTLAGTRHIAGLERTPDGHYLLRLRNSQERLRVSRRHVEKVRRWLHEHQPG